LLVFEDTNLESDLNLSRAWRRRRRSRRRRDKWVGGVGG
jgi:hypothetical protein